MKTLLIIFLFAITFSSGSAQENVIVKYYDAQWSPCSKEKAVYYAQFRKQDTLYKCTSYYAKSDKLCGKSTFADTLFKKGVGLMVRYYENGNLHDSSFFDNTGKTTYALSYYETGKLETSIHYVGQNFTTDHYYPSGQLFVHAYRDPASEKTVSEGYDENGKLISGFIYQQEAEFPGGKSSWMNYLTNNIKSDIPAKRKAPVGSYSVSLQFIIDKDGNVTNVVAENDPGYGSKEEAERVLKNSPKWKPAIQLNKLVSYRATQKITFTVSNS
ncbi:energy transducer TonB [Chitinophagaceae bacterium LWZ2-11]